MDSITLLKLQDVEFQILKDIDLYCKKHNIKYSLYAGTMLGAVRHGGFIPWDDDVDISMTRSEYNKFCECIKNHPMDGYIFSNCQNDKNCMVCHGKLRKKNTLLLQEGEIESIGHHEIWIDIFPLDKISLNKKISNKTKRLGKELVFLTRANGRLTNESVFKKASRIIIKSIPGRRFRLNKVINELIKLDGQIIDNYEWVSMSTLKNIDTIRFPKEMIENYSILTFNGESFMSFEDYDAMLRIIYGDYMKLPPKAERICTHSPVKIEF